MDILYKAKWNPDLPESLTVRSKVQTAVKFTLHVIANPYPTSIVWFHPNQKKAIGENFTPTMINDSAYTLSKTSVRSSDYGNYTVHVTNAVGVSSFVFELKHTGPPHTPCCLKKVNATAISVTLTFKSNDNGGTPQTFTIEHRERGGDWIVAAMNLADPGFNKDVVQKIAKLKSNLIHGFRVKAANADGDSGYGNVLEVKTPATPNTTLLASRNGWVATLTWTALKQSYSKVQIKYCRREISSTACSYYHLNDPTATTAKFNVDFMAMYDIYLEVFDGVDMVYRSAPVVLSLGVHVWIIVGVGVAVVILIVVVVVVVLRRRKKACFSDKNKGKAGTMDSVTGMSEITGPDAVVPVDLYVNVDNSGFQEDADSWFDDSEFDDFQYDVNPQRVQDQNEGIDATMNSVAGMSKITEQDAVANRILYVNVDHSAFQEDANSWVDEADFDEFQYDVRVQEGVYGETTPEPGPSGGNSPIRIEDLSVDDFKRWLLSKRVTKSTYKRLAKNGLKEASIFVLLEPAHVEELKIKPLGQKILVHNLVKCFQQGIETKSSKIRLRPSGYEDEGECEEMDNPYVELNITHVASRTFTELKRRFSSVR